MQSTTKHQHKRNAFALFSVALLTTGALLIGGCGNDDEKKPAAEGGAAAGAKPGGGGAAAAPEVTPVRTAKATQQVVERRVPITGSIAALQTVSLSARVSARVTTVAGREGTLVRRGQVVVQQDTTDFQIALEQAQANLQQARANVLSQQAALRQSTARLQSAQTQVGLQSSTSSIGVRDAQQQLRSAQSALTLAKRPQRTEEVAVTANQVAQAQANYDRAKSDRERYDSLVKDGAAAQITLDQYINTERVNKSALDTTKQQQTIAQEGGRQASVRQAETAVRRAEAALRLAQSNVGQVGLRRDDVGVARGAVESARGAIAAAQASVAQLQAAVRNARQQIAYASIVSPIDGVITTRGTEPGQQAAPGATVLQVVALDSVYYEAAVPEVETASMRVGLPVQVRVDAFPGKVFTGKIAKLLPTASRDSRTFTVRVTLPNPGRALRPGYYARGEVIAEQRRAIVVPRDAVIGEDKIFTVYTIANNKAKRNTVRLGIQTAKIAEIRGGVIQEGDEIIVAGQDGLKDGAPISVKNNAETATANAAGGATPGAPGNEG